MLKWREYTEAGTLFEAFLPEHDGEGQSALLRAVRRGYIVSERSVSLTWRPMFGPDSGDVAAMDAELDRMIVDLHLQPAPEVVGPYVPGPIEIQEPDPYAHAAVHALLVESQEAVAELVLTPEQVSAWFALPDHCALHELYPVAITPRRADGMRKAIALRRLLEGNASLRVRRAKILAALVRGDADAVRDQLEAAGISTDPAPD